MKNKNFKHNLKSLYTWLIKFYPELDNNQVKDYCYISTYFKDSSGYNYSYNSLKWLIFSLRDHLDYKNIQKLFYNLMIEYKSLNKSFSDLQNKITSFPAAKTYEPFLQQTQSDSVDISKFNVTKYSDFIKIVENNTGLNLTSLFFNKTDVTIICGFNPLNSSAHVIFKNNSFLVEKCQPFIFSIFDSIAKIEPGWKILNENKYANYLLNPGVDQKMFSKLTSLQLHYIIKNELYRSRPVIVFSNNNKKEYNSYIEAFSVNNDSIVSIEHL